MSSYWTSQRSGSSIASQSAGPDSNLGQTLTTLTKDFRIFLNLSIQTPGENLKLGDTHFFFTLYTQCIIDYILITNLMHWLLFIHKILFSSTCFEPQVLIFRRIQLYTCSLWYCHSLWEFLVACRYTAWVRHPPTTFPLQSVLAQAVYRQATRNSPREWQYHRLRVYNCILLKMSTWGSKHVEENNILWINNNQCIKLVIS